MTVPSGTGRSRGQRLGRSVEREDRIAEQRMPVPDDLGAGLERGRDRAAVGRVATRRSRPVASVQGPDPRPWKVRVRPSALTSNAPPRFGLVDPLVAVVVAVAQGEADGAQQQHGDHHEGGRRDARGPGSTRRGRSPCPDDGPGRARPTIGRPDDSHSTRWRMHRADVEPVPPVGAPAIPRPSWLREATGGIGHREEPGPEHRLEAARSSPSVLQPNRHDGGRTFRWMEVPPTADPRRRCARCRADR